jgi:hypothetical protein
MTEATNMTSQQATNTAQPANGQAPNATATAQDGQQQKDESLTFDAWYGKLDDKQKDLLDDHVTGLKSALTSEREERRRLSTQLKQLSKSAEDGSEFQKQLQDTLGKLDDAERKAHFLESAHGQGVTNLKLAWLAAKDAELIDKRTGEVNFLKLREVAPELFERKVTPTGNAGTGNGQAGTVKPDMSKWIRAAAGRG